MATQMVIRKVLPFSAAGMKSTSRLVSVTLYNPRFSSTSAGRAVRKIVSSEERAALRAARKQQATQQLQQMEGGGGGGGGGEAFAASTGTTTTASASAGTSRQLLASRYIWYLAVGIPTAILVWGFNDENSPPAKFVELVGLGGVIRGFTEQIAMPSHEKLLPDWSQMPNVPHDIPVPHTLVLDLENTLVSSTWDRKFGWRHAKRPGVDKFLMDMAQYYEIVLYSPSMDAVADPVVSSLDKSGCIMHRLYRDATYYKNGVHVKDLNRLNRSVKRMVVLDDDPSEVQFNPENLIPVKPYTDPSDRSDDTLARITPFLIEIVREGYNDIPALLKQYEGMDADEIADEQERRIEYFRQSREARANRGLSGLARSARKVVDMEPELPAQQASFAPTQQLTSKDLVGPPPPSAEQESGLVGFFARRQKEKEENDRRKFEKWNQVMMKKQKEREEKANAAAAAAAS